MKSIRFLGAAVLIILLALSAFATSCFGTTGGSSPTATPTPDVTRPKPSVVSTAANYSGTQAGYFVTLDINIKNDGSEGTILVQATVTQNGVSTSNEMPVFVKKGASGETKMTFPLVWKGGDATYSIKAITP